MGGRTDRYGRDCLVGPMSAFQGRKGRDQTRGVRKSSPERRSGAFQPGRQRPPEAPEKVAKQGPNAASPVPGKPAKPK